MSEFKKVCTDIPNRLVLLVVKDPGKDALYDVAPGETFVTMGHWYPDKNEPNLGHQKQPKLLGTWKAVGWDWCQDTFVENESVIPVSWAELPTP
jgi:hypothetical protein